MVEGIMEFKKEAYEKSKDISKERVAEIIEEDKKALAVKGPGNIKMYLNDESFNVILDEINGMLGSDRPSGASLFMMVGLELKRPSVIKEHRNGGEYKAEVRLSYSVADKFDSINIIKRIGEALSYDLFELLMLGDQRKKELFLASMDGIKVVSDKNHGVSSFDLLVGDKIELRIRDDEEAKEIDYECTIALGLEADKKSVEREIEQKRQQKEK